MRVTFWYNWYGRPEELLRGRRDYYLTTFYVRLSLLPHSNHHLGIEPNAVIAKHFSYFFSVHFFKLFLFFFWHLVTNYVHVICPMGRTYAFNFTPGKISQLTSPPSIPDNIPPRKDNEKWIMKSEKCRHYCFSPVAINTGAGAYVAQVICWD